MQFIWDGQNKHNHGPYYCAQENKAEIFHCAAELLATFQSPRQKRLHPRPAAGH